MVWKRFQHQTQNRSSIWVQRLSFSFLLVILKVQLNLSKIKWMDSLALQSTFLSPQPSALLRHNLCSLFAGQLSPLLFLHYATSLVVKLYDLQCIFCWDNSAALLSDSLFYKKHCMQNYWPLNASWQNVTQYNSIINLINLTLSLKNKT